MAKEDIERYQFTSEQSRTKAAENGRKGGIASGIAKRERQTAQAVARAILDEMLHAKDGSEVTIRYAMLRKAAEKAYKGDLRAMETLVKISGEMPAEKREVTGKDGAPLMDCDYNIGDLSEEQLLELADSLQDAQAKRRKEQ